MLVVIRFGFFDASFDATLLQPTFGEEIFGEARIEFAGIIKKLRGTPSVVFTNNLHGSPDAVFQLIVRIDADVFVELLVLLVTGDHDAANEKVIRMVYGQTELAIIFVSDFDPIHLLQVNRIGAAESNRQALFV